MKGIKMTNMISADNAAILAAKSIAAGKLSAAAAPAAAQGGKMDLSAAAADNDRLTAILESLSRSSAETAKALSAVSSRLGNLRGCGCCGCCCCGGGGAAVSSRDTVYAVFAGLDYADGKTTLKLVSYNRPLTSQTEADAVEVIIFLGGETSREQVGGNQPFTLDGFAMPGGFDVDFFGINSYPASFLRKKDGSGWIPLTRQDVVHGEWMNMLYVLDSYLPPENINGKSLLCCGMFEHNCRGKTFYAQIPDGENWPEEQKQRAAVFYLRKDTISYDSFPNHESYFINTREDDGNYTDLPIWKDYNSGSSSWGELIEKFGDKVFEVRIFPDGINITGMAFAMD